MKITKIISSTLRNVNIHGKKFQIAEVWKYAAISEYGLLILFKEKPELMNDYWISDGDECSTARVAFTGNFRTSLIELKEE